MTTPQRLRAGVVGVGSMGAHHARVYNELPSVELAGVADADETQADRVAEKYGTRARPSEELLDAVDVVSVAVPTRFHHEVAREAIERDVDVLVEKPFVREVETGRELVNLARERDCTLQVGHVERFNPVVEVLRDVVPELEVIAVSARRLGPPVDRDGSDDVVMDLMVHDVDLLCSLVDRDLASVAAMSARDEDHVTAQLRFEGDVVGSLTASRVTQEKIRDLAITARSCRIDVDYMDQSVEIHRHSVPEYEADDGDVRFRHESVVERPAVDSGEPLKRELTAFVDAVRNDEEPVVTGTEGLRAIRVSRRIAELAAGGTPRGMEVNASELTTV